MSLQHVMQRYCQGENGAFEELYRVLAPKLRARIRLLVRDGAVADDVLQLTFLKLHGARGSYRAGADPVPWVMAIASRNCFDELRRRQLRERLAISPEDLPEPPVDITGAPLETCETPDVRLPDANLSSALQQLPANLREAVVLTKLRGHSVRQAAQILGATEAAVKLRAHRGYARLRVLLSAQEEPCDGEALQQASLLLRDERGGEGLELAAGLDGRCPR